MPFGQFSGQMCALTRKLENDDNRFEPSEKIIGATCQDNSYVPARTSSDGTRVPRVPGRVPGFVPGYPYPGTYPWHSMHLILQIMPRLYIVRFRRIYIGRSGRGEKGRGPTLKVARDFPDF
eukprot:28195-Rhodomonas_salina.1